MVLSPHMEVAAAELKMVQLEEKGIIPKYEYSKAGKALYRLCAGWTMWLVKHRWLYYVMSWSWGVIMSVIGVVAAVGARIVFGKSAKMMKYRWTWHQEVGKCWGGVSLGMNFFKDKECTGEETRSHEFGHSFQNALLGPIAIVVAFVPSMIRYWYQTWADKKGKPVKNYDAVWFEGAASDCGEWAAAWIEAREEYKAAEKAAKDAKAAQKQEQKQEK